jgi:trigger factor
MSDEAKSENEETATATEAAPTDAENVAEGEQPPEKLRQTVEMRDIGPCKKYIKVSIEREDVQKALDNKYSELRVEASVPGFRPGKTPRKVIERRFAKEVQGEVKGQILLASLEQLAEEHDVAPLAMPNIDPGRVEIPAEGPMVYEFEVEVRPEFELPNYKGLKLRRPIKEFSDSDIEQEERRLLAPYGQLVPKTKGVAEIGDYVIADIYAKVGDRVITDLKEVKVRVDPQLAFKDGVARKFGEQMKKAKAGDVRDVDITLSEAAADASLRNQTLKTTFTIKDVKSMRLPELTEEFLQPFSVRTPEQLRERVRVLLQRRLEYHQRQSVRQQVLEQIAAASQWELPRDLLMRQARRALHRRVMEMRSSGMAEDEIRGRQRLLEQDVLRHTEMALKEHFVLQKIAETEKIDVDDNEIADEIDRLADQHNESPRRLRARMEKEDLIEVLAIEMIERKVLDMILESAEYQDVPLDVQDEGQTVATVEEQAVPGVMHDPTAPPPEEKKEEPEGEEEAKAEPKTGKTKTKSEHGKSASNLKE